MNSNHCQLFTILIGFRTASPNFRDVVVYCDVIHILQSEIHFAATN